MRNALLGSLLCLALGQGAPAAAGWHVAAYLGSARTADADLDIDKPGAATRLSFRDVAFEGRSFEGPVYYGLRAGRDLGLHLGLEAEFIHLKAYGRVDRVAQAAGTLRGETVDGPLRIDEVVRRFSISHGANLVLANLVVRHALGSERLVLAARLGLGGTIAHPESDVLGEGDQHYEWGGLATQLAGGVEVNTADRVFLLGEYKLTRTAPAVAIAGGEARTRLLSHHLVFGAGLRF